MKSKVFESRTSQERPGLVANVGEIQSKEHPLYETFVKWCQVNQVKPNNKAARKFLKKFSVFLA